MMRPERPPHVRGDAELGRGELLITPTRYRDSPARGRELSSAIGRLPDIRTMEARMRFRVLLTLVAVLVVSACGGTNSGSSDPIRGGAAAEGVHASEALVYAAVIRRLVTKDHGFGTLPSPYRHVYVLDGVVPTAADPMHLVSEPAKPFAEGLGLQIAAALRQLPPLTFVGSRRLAISGSAPGHVVHGG